MTFTGWKGVLDHSVPQTEPRASVPINGDVMARARAYIAKMPEAIEGDNGSKDCFNVARKLADFGLSEDQVFQVLRDDYNGRCKPRWSDAELEHKAKDAVGKRREKNPIPDRPKPKTNGSATRGAVAEGGASNDARRENCGKAADYQPTDADAPDAPPNTPPNAEPGPSVTKPPRLPFLWVRDFGEFRKPAPLRWLLRDTRTSKPFLRAGKCSVLSGDGGVGKGFFWLQLAVCIALGHDLFDTFRPEQSGRVALLCGEDDQDEVHHRLVRIANALGLGNDDVARVQERVGVFPLAGEQVALQAIDPAHNPFRTATFETLVEQLKELATDGDFEWSLIGLDPLARFGAANVETDQSAATAFVQALESMSARLPGAPASGVTHHSSAASAKTGRSNVRGVTGLRNAFRLAMILDAYETETGLRGVLLRNDKNNLAPVARPLWLVRMENEPMGDGRWLETAGVLRRASDDEAKELDAAAGTSSCASREQREQAKSEKVSASFIADCALLESILPTQGTMSRSAVEAELLRQGQSWGDGKLDARLAALVRDGRAHDLSDGKRSSPRQWARVTRSAAP